jgi:hypothetical protein
MFPLEKIMAYSLFMCVYLLKDKNETSSCILYCRKTHEVSWYTVTSIQSVPQEEHIIASYTPKTLSCLHFVLHNDLPSAWLRESFLSTYIYTRYYHHEVPAPGLCNIAFV